jgi:hypothetical protein
MSQLDQMIHVSDVEANRYLRSKLRAIQIQQTPEQTPEPTPEKLGKKIAWGPVLKIDPKEIEKQTV